MSFSSFLGEVWWDGLFVLLLLSLRFQDFSCCCMGCFSMCSLFILLLYTYRVLCWLTFISAIFGFDCSVVSVCLCFIFLVSGGLLVVVSVCCIVVRRFCFRGFVLFLDCVGAILVLCCVVFS